MVATTVPMQRELDDKKAAIDKLSSDFDELQAAFREHVDESDLLIERQSDDLRIARKALAAVNDAMALGNFGRSDDDGAAKN